MIYVRASSCDRIMSCNFSSIKPEMKIDTSGPFTYFGNCGHSIMAKIVKHDMTTLPDISKELENFQVDPTQERSLRIACHIGLKEYRDTISPSIDRQHLISETKHSRQIDDDHTLTGHPDLACLLHDQKTLFCADWKFGEVSNHWNQLKAYVFILLQYYPQVENVLLGQYFFRENDKVVREFTVEHIMEEWLVDFKQALASDTLKPSWDSCKYCHVMDCKARDRLSHDTIATLSTVDHTVTTAVAMADRYEDVKLVQKKIDQYKEHLKDQILMTGEAIQLTNGNVLDVEDDHRDTLYLNEAIDVLKGYFKPDSLEDLITLLSPCITMKKGALEDLIGQRAPNRMKGKEKTRIKDEMDAAGAIKTKSFKTLKLQKGK